MQQQPPLIVIQLNCCGCTPNKRAELQHLLMTTKADVVLLQETFFSPTTSRAETRFAVPSFLFDTYRQDTASGAARRGLAILLRRCPELLLEEVSVSTIPDRRLVVTPNEEIEAQQAIVRWHGTPLVLTNVYAPPEACISEPFSPACLDFCLAPYPDLPHVIAGDFNAHHASWDTHMGEDKRGLDIDEWAENNGFAVVNDPAVPTRAPIRNGQQQLSSPDVTMLSGTLHSHAWRALPAINNCDHLPLIFNVFFTNPAEVQRLRTLPRAGMCKLASKINKEQWDEFNKTAQQFISEKPVSQWGSAYSVKKLYERLEKALQYAAKKLPRGCRRDPVPWWDADLDNAVNARDLLRFHVLESVEARKEWHAACQAVTKVLGNTVQLNQLPQQPPSVHVAGKVHQP